MFGNGPLNVGQQFVGKVEHKVEYPHKTDYAKGSLLVLRWNYFLSIS